MCERKDIRRLKGWLECFPDSVIWIIGGKKDISIIGADRLKELGITNEIKVFSQYTEIDGLKCDNAIIVLYNKWWLNPVANTDTWKFYMENARYVMQIGEL